MDRNKSGVALIELIIAVGIFSFMIVIAVNSFMSVITIGRESTQRQAMQDHAEFLFSLMSKEIRMARVNNDASVYNNCVAFFASHGIDQGQLYGVETGVNPTDSDKLMLINNYGECVRYSVETDASNNNIKRLKVERHTQAGADLTAWVTPVSISVDSLRFKVQAMVRNQGAMRGNRSASVAYSMKLNSAIWNPQNVTYFNFVAARNLEQF